MGLIFLLHRHKIMAKIHLLVNLKSGSNRGEKSLKQIETVLKNEKMDYDIHISNYPGQLFHLQPRKPMKLVSELNMLL